MRNNRHYLAACLAGLAMLSACTPAVITRVDNKGVADNTAIAPGNFTVIRPTKTTPSAEWNAAHDAVIAALSARGLNAADPAAYTVEITLSSRPANLALTVESEKGTEVIAPSNGKKAGKSCVNNDYRVAIGISRIADGALIYQGAAAETHCTETLLAITPILVKAAMADFGAPKGGYSVQRKKPRLR
jgi:hypothetical protein